MSRTAITTSASLAILTGLGLVKGVQCSVDHLKWSCSVHAVKELSRHVLWRNDGGAMSIASPLVEALSRF